jgi:prophage antirepressor-like protein
MNELMNFEGNNVEVFELNGKVLFNPRDVAKCLNLGDSAIRMAIGKMSDKQVIKVTNSNVKDIDFRKLHNTGENFLTESGVYKLIFKSNKEEAEKLGIKSGDIIQKINGQEIKIDSDILEMQKGTNEL